MQTSLSSFFQVIPVGPLGTNCILVNPPETDILYIVDPGFEAQRILRAVAAFPKVKRFKILFTHCHVDHITAAPEVAEHLLLTCGYLHPEDKTLYESPHNDVAPYIPAAEKLLPVIWPLDDANVRVIHCPGHSAGGVSYYFPSLKLLLSGDTLFREGVGRTDFYSGDMQALIHSIREKLFKLPPDTVVIPGHGDETSIVYEMDNNPYLN